ncbi:electron transfer flavoprotein subunit alpha/FixB family protein [Aliamphritea hakodatensis]|uniref:electron transfer flavoprotein subunit alpha/FixB family protein n=1 Tax=Aliamphritea hakodatensis TaxID=2895352 RepID=UPI0022FDA9FC|nr:FAD-binding protein [Aliamphritea hakodatensis]
MTILVIAEHDNQQLNVATLNSVRAAEELKQAGAGDLHLLVAGSDCAAVSAQAAAVAGADKVLVMDSSALAQQLAENLAPAVVALTKDAGYSHIIAASSTSAKNVLPRIAALLDVAQVSDIIEVCSADTFVRPIYAGNALAKVQSSDAVKVISVRTTAFEAVAADGGQAEVQTLEQVADQGVSRFIGEEKSNSERPELASARVIISGGRGMQSGDNFPLLEKVADKIGAAVGASRAAVDAGFVSNDYQVGQTGKIVAPELYIAVGISGAIQHLAGMKDSKVIVAINKDDEAPIFNVADYGLVADLFEALPELEQQV